MHGAAARTAAPGIQALVTDTAGVKNGAVARLLAPRRWTQSAHLDLIRRQSPPKSFIAEVKDRLVCGINTVRQADADMWNLQRLCGLAHC